MVLLPRIKLIVYIFSLALLNTLVGCDGDGIGYNDDSLDTTGTTTSNSGLQLNVPVPPQVSWKDSNGKTQVILQFSVRDDNGVPMQQDEFEVELKVNDNPIDGEALLNESAQELEVNLYFAMVLDASYSMTLHNPAAFEPMKTAASDTYQEILDLWSTRPGNVKFSLIWFDELMNQSQYNENLARGWLPADILSIPAPMAGASTKLHSAVNEMAVFLQAEYSNGVFNGSRDQYVMLVFSDGADNYSWWDNSTVDSLLNTTSGASYHQFGTAVTTLETAKQKITEHPSLTTHVIGLGSAINSDELNQIAEVGHGTYVDNPGSENIAQLFQRVLQEFTTLQTRGAEIPLQAGEYDFTLVVKNSVTGEKAESSFRFKTGDYDAGVIDTP